MPWLQYQKRRLRSKLSEGTFGAPPSVAHGRQLTKVTEAESTDAFDPQVLQRSEEVDAREADLVDQHHLPRGCAMERELEDEAACGHGSLKQMA